MQPSNKPLKETVLASWYQGESLEAYLDAMFGYYDKENTINEEVKGGSTPLTVMGKRYRSTFEAILAKFGLDLTACTFEEIISGDYYLVLKRHGLIDHQPSNNPSFESLGGVI